MSLFSLALILTRIAGIVGFLLAGWTARSYVGERWLPHLASAWTFGPMLGSLAVAIPLTLAGLADGPHNAVLVLANGVMDFALYGILALMLVLIGRRLPERTADRQDR